MLLLKLLGLGYLEILNNVTYLKWLCYISCLFGIIYQLLNLFILYKFSKGNIKVSEILPEFVQNWLKEFEEICQNKEAIKEVRNMFYREILVYIFIIIFFALIF
jgi:hypothetical protein